MAVLCDHKFYAQPKKAEAAEQMFPAEANFRSQNYELALNGDGNVLGFSQVIDEYGSYAGDAAFFHAGVCELQHGKYEEALSSLVDVSMSGVIILQWIFLDKGNILIPDFPRCS